MERRIERRGSLEALSNLEACGSRGLNEVLRKCCHHANMISLPKIDALGVTALSPRGRGPGGRMHAHMVTGHSLTHVKCPMRNSAILFPTPLAKTKKQTPPQGCGAWPLQWLSRFLPRCCSGKQTLRFALFLQAFLRGGGDSKSHAVSSLPWE